MEILENKKKLDVFLSNIREKNHKIGFIPTMGSIYKGHLSFVEKSKTRLFVAFYIDDIRIIDNFVLY